MLKLGTISLDGTRIHADASRHHAVSYKRLLELETQLRAEIEELFRLSEQSDQPDIPDGLVVREEMARREDRLVRRAVAKAVLQARASERLASEQAEYETKLAQRAERERTTGRRPGGRGSGESAHRRMGPLSSPQRLSRSRTHARCHSIGDWHARGGGTGCWVFWPRNLDGM